MVSNLTLTTHTLKMNSDIQPAKPKVWANEEDWVETVEKIPVWMMPFVGKKTPAEFLETYIPRDKLEAMAGAMSGFVDLGITVPEWAKKASFQFWKNYIGNKPLHPTKSAEDFGVMVVMLEKFTQGHFTQLETAKPPSKLEKLLGKIAKKVYSLLMDKIVSKFSHEEKAQFYAGCVRGEKILARMLNPDHIAMIKRAQVYVVIAAVWRQFEKFPSHAAAERWLRAEKVIGDEESFSSREVYSVFQVIGLPGASVGRPKKLETRHDEIAES